MGRKCAVPHCYTGYRNCKEKAALYRVPDDDFFLTKWQEAIARADRPITPKDYVCEKHFTDDDILRRRIIKDVVEEYQRPRLKPDAIPSIFPDLPEFILKMVKKRRKMPLENEITTDNSVNALKENCETENNINNEVIDDVKEEPVDNIEMASAVLLNNRDETILNNEIDIKSEPEEHITDSVEGNGDNERDDPSFLGQKIYYCDQCEYKSKYAHNVRTHKTKHLTGEEAYLRCQHCPNYKTKWELTFRNHLKIKHGIGKQEVFKCSLCMFETKVKLCLKRHYERHNRGIFDKTLSCKFPGCDYTEESKALLNIHMLTHSKKNAIADSKLEKPKSFKCTECFYETNSKTHIIRHIKSAHNTGDDTVVSITAKQQPLSENSTGAAEEVDYVKEKSFYKCLKCSYKSGFRTNLLRHLFKHKKSRPLLQKGLQSKVWKCPKCPYATFFQHALKKHTQDECKDIYPCTECNFRLYSKSDYIRHTLTHRNITVDCVDRGNILSGEAETVCVEPDIQNNVSFCGDGEDKTQLTSQTGDEQLIESFHTGKIKEEVGIDKSNTLQEFTTVRVKEEIHT